jgi:hypothetical protein
MVTPDQIKAIKTTKLESLKIYIDDVLREQFSKDDYACAYVNSYCQSDVNLVIDLYTQLGWVIEHQYNPQKEISRLIFKLPEN